MGKQRYRLAVGLRYAPGQRDGATPSVSLKGEEILADRIVSLARKHGVPVVEDSSLARSLAALALDEQIPPALFEAVAVVLAALERSLGQLPSRLYKTRIVR